MGDRPSEEALLSHADFIRRLARSVVLDDHRAEDVTQGHRYVEGHGVLQNCGVSGQAIGELAGAPVVEELDVLAQDGAEEPGAKVGYDALACDRE